MSVSTYPVRVDAHLDPGLNRWLWLLKWLLVAATRANDESALLSRTLRVLRRQVEC